MEESAAYLAGLTGLSDVTAMVRQHRDRMLVRIGVDALQKRVEGFHMAGKDPQRRSMQLVADAWALSQALPTLDDYTLVCTRWAVPLTGTPSPRMQEALPTNGMR